MNSANGSIESFAGDDLHALHEFFAQRLIGFDRVPCPLGIT
jgi:hypothetical protein